MSGRRPMPPAKGSPYYRKEVARGRRSSSGGTNRAGSPRGPVYHHLHLRHDRHPKGVPLTHANMTSQVRNLPFEPAPSDRALTILPVWHSYERVFGWWQSRWESAHTTPTSAQSAKTLKTVRPTVMASAPRLWEGVYVKADGPYRRRPLSIRRNKLFPRRRSFERAA